jgi:hypothetical protein
MFRTIVTAAAVCLLAAQLAAGEEVKYDRKITHVRYDPEKQEELGRKENVEAKAEGDPAKDAEVIWHVRSSTFTTVPVVGDLFLDDRGRAWSIQRADKAPGGERYLFACRRLAQPPVPPSE